MEVSARLQLSMAFEQGVALESIAHLLNQVLLLLLKVLCGDMAVLQLGTFRILVTNFLLASIARRRHWYPVLLPLQHHEGLLLPSCFFFGLGLPIIITNKLLCLALTPLVLGFR